MRVRMSRSAPREITRAGLRFTPRGAGFALLAAGLLAAGALRSELGALLCGAGLAAAILASLAGVAYEGRRQSLALAADPEALRPSLSPAARDGKPGLRAAFRVENRGIPLPRAPGTSAWAEVRGETRQGRTAGASAALPAPGSAAETDFPASGSLLRGVYRGAGTLVAGDAFGFWRSVRELPGGLETAAFPESGPGPVSAPRGSGGSRSDLSDRRIRGDDRFDSRPYLPGDDPRRLHWKLFARFGDLFVRPGDLSPPPRKTVRILLDTERPGYLRGDAGEYYLDSLFSAALGYARGLEDRGCEIRFFAPGMPDAPADPAGRLYWLADLAWGDVGEDLRNPGPEPLVVFGAPGASRRGGFLGVRSAAGLAAALVVPDLPGPSGRAGWIRFFLADGGSGRGESARMPDPGRALRAAFREALDRERLGPAGSGGFDVRLV